MRMTSMFGSCVVGASLREWYLLPSRKGATEAKPVPCRFWIGWDGPSNPQMKRPTYRISKLSELENPEVLQPARSPSKITV
jgi:hypothetical protein